MAIGYACITLGVPGTDISRCILKNATEEKLRIITLKNLSALDKMIDYNRENDITLFRISSDMIPFGSHPINCIKWWEDYRDILKELGNKIKKADIRISMHPGQYTVLNSPNQSVVENAVKDLEYHERFLSCLEADWNHKLILHIGGVYGDKGKAMNNFIMNYSVLSDRIKNRLVIENDDKSFTIEDVLKINEHTGIPVVFDNLHNKVNPPSFKLSEAEWIMRCSKTWLEPDGNQKIHYSQQKTGGKPGSHSDTILLDEFMDFYAILPSVKPDIMLEVKDKNLSAIKCIVLLQTTGCRTDI